MNLTAKIEAKQQQETKTLPAPPAALWTFAALFVVSALWGILHS